MGQRGGVERGVVGRVGRVALRPRRGEGLPRDQLRGRRGVLDVLQGLHQVLRPAGDLQPQPGCAGHGQQLPVGGGDLPGRVGGGGERGRVQESHQYLRVQPAVPDRAGGPRRGRRGQQVHRDHQPDAAGPPGYEGRGAGPSNRWVRCLPPQGRARRPPRHGVLQVQRVLRPQQGVHQPARGVRQVPTAARELRHRPLHLQPQRGGGVPAEGVYRKGQQRGGNVIRGPRHPATQTRPKAGSSGQNLAWKSYPNRHPYPSTTLLQYF